MSVWWSLYCVAPRPEDEARYVSVEELMEKGDLTPTLDPDDLLKFIAFSSQTSSEVAMAFSEAGLELPRHPVPRWVQWAYVLLLPLHIPFLLPLALGLLLLGTTRSWAWALVPLGAWLLASLLDALALGLRSRLIPTLQTRNRGAKTDSSRRGPVPKRLLLWILRLLRFPLGPWRLLGFLRGKLKEKTVVRLAPRRWVREAGHPVSFRWIDEPTENAYAPNGPGPVHDPYDVLASLEAMLEETRKRDDQLPKSYHFRIPLEYFEVIDESLGQTESYWLSMGWPCVHEAPDSQREVECWRPKIQLQGKTYILEGGWDLCRAKSEDGQDVIDLRDRATLAGIVTLKYPPGKLRDGPIPVRIAVEPASQWLYKYMLEDMMRVCRTALKHGWKVATCWS